MSQIDLDKEIEVLAHIEGDNLKITVNRGGLCLYRGILEQVAQDDLNLEQANMWGTDECLTPVNGRWQNLQKMLQKAD